MSVAADSNPEVAHDTSSGDADSHRSSSTLGAAFNVFCTVIGTGLLQVAYGTARTGWIGVGLLLFMGVMSCYTAIVLIRSLGLIHEINRQRSEMGCSPKSKCAAMPAETWGDLGEAVFGTFGRHFVSVLNYITLVMVGVVFNLLAGLNLASVVPEDWLTPEAAIVTASCIMWFHVFLKTLGEVAMVSALNTMVSLLLALAVVVESLRHPPMQPAQTIMVEANLLQLGSGFASFTMAFGCHNVLPTVYATMRRPDAYSRMIKGTFCAIVAVTLPVMCVGYGVYGAEVRSPIYLTPALGKSTLVKVMVALITIHLFGAYPLILNPPETALESVLGVEHRRCSLLWRVSLRTAFVLVTCGVAIVMKSSFPPLLELVASFSLSLTVFVLPCLFYARLSQMAGMPLTNAELAWCGVIISVSLVGAVFGFTGAIQDVLKSFGA